MSKLRHPIFIFALLFHVGFLFGQNPDMLPKFKKSREIISPNYGFGILGGIKSSSSGYGIFFEYLIVNRIEVNIGLAASRYMGVGFSSGTKIHILGKIKFSPFVGFNFISQPGTRFYFTDDKTNVSYNTLPNNYYNTSAGLRYNEDGISIFCALNYSLQQYKRSVIVENNTGKSDKESEINEKIGSGLGFTVGLSLHWW